MAIILLLLVLSAYAQTQVQISEWEYCEGCMKTVEIVGIRANERVREMAQQARIPSGSEMDGGHLLNHICDHTLYRSYRDAVRYSCIKMLDDETTRNAFLKGFHNYDVNLDFNDRSATYNRKRDICAVGLQICPMYLFKETPEPKAPIKEASNKTTNSNDTASAAPSAVSTNETEGAEPAAAATETPLPTEEELAAAAAAAAAAEAEAAAAAAAATAAAEAEAAAEAAALANPPMPGTIAYAEAEAKKKAAKEAEEKKNKKSAAKRRKKKSKSSKWSRCQACHIIADNLDADRLIRNEKHVTLSELLENVCLRLGYTNYPYSWIENHCYNLVEEHFDTIIEVLKFREKVEAAGVRPTEHLSLSLCGEVYSECYVEPAKSKGVEEEL